VGSLWPRALPPSLPHLAAYNLLKFKGFCASREKGTYSLLYFQR
jgi:hypothetical protein